MVPNVSRKLDQRAVVKEARHQCSCQHHCPNKSHSKKPHSEAERKLDFTLARFSGSIRR